MLLQTKAEKRKKKKRKWPPPLLLSSSSSLLISCLTSTLSLSRLSYICQEHGLHLNLSPWFQLLYGAGHVFTVYIMGCWEKRGRTGVLVPFGCHIQVCETLCVFLMWASCLLFSERRWEQQAIWRDGHHNSNSNWMGCTASAQWAQACGQVCLLYVKAAGWEPRPKVRTTFKRPITYPWIRDLAEGRTYPWSVGNSSYSYS